MIAGEVERQAQCQCRHKDSGCQRHVGQVGGGVLGFAFDADPNFLNFLISLRRQLRLQLQNFLPAGNTPVQPIFYGCQCIIY